MKTFQRYLSSINKGSIVEVLDLPTAVLDHWQSFLRYRKTDGNDYEPDTLLGFAAKYTYGLLTKFVRSRWLDIGQVLFLRVYGPRLS